MYRQQAQDDGFHEIQLNGKQLVFLFMAATVVSVVIFLCGVLVGRGVRAEKASVSEVQQTTVADAIPQPPPATTATPSGSDPTIAAPPPATDDLSGPKQQEAPAASTSKPETPPHATEPAPPPEPAHQAQPAHPADTKAPSAVDSSAAGFAVQVAALNVKSEADAIVKRLHSKGYAAYVLAPAEGTPAVFRVRVGKFASRRDAEVIAAKLQKEEQFRPWVTR